MTSPNRHDQHEALVWPYLGGGAAGPLRGRDPTARVPLGAADLPGAVTWSVRGLGPYHRTLRDAVEQHLVLLLTRAGLHVAGVALWTAVLVVGTAHRLENRSGFHRWI